MTNTDLLNASLKVKKVTVEQLAKKCNLSTEELQKKINNEEEFLYSEIVAISDCLKLDQETRDFIFFAE